MSGELYERDSVLHPWAVCVTNRPGMRWTLWWFRHRHLAVQFAERRGIRLETT